MVACTLIQGRETDKHEMEDFYDQLLTKEMKFMAPVRQLEKKWGFFTPLKWSNVIIITLFHIIIPICIIHVVLTGNFLKETFIFQITVGHMGAFGVTAGAHRLWSHRSYKARMPLKLLLLMCYAIAGQNNLYEWVRDHRVHHKNSETSSDPHNAKRGFFFSHVGWLMMKKHPHVIREGSKIDMSDITSDPLLVFFNRYFNILKLLFCFLIPTVIPVWCFGEHLYRSLVGVLMRYLIGLNSTWLVNSLAHLHGLKPYDKSIFPSEHIGVSFITMGEGWHNYHHTFPWDYKAAELPYFVNTTTLLLDIAAYAGQAYDMKIASSSLVKAVASKRGDKKRFE